MPYSSQLKINLKDDWVRIVTGYIVEKGHKVPPCKDHLDLGVYFCNLNYMRIPAMPRKVILSKEFKCPPMYRKRVEKLKRRIEKGEDINAYLSSGISRIKNRDGLLYDWGIHHVHLGEKKENKKFSERTNELLYVYMTNEVIYFLNVLDHDSFGNRKLLSIIHNNWPELIKDYLIPGATAVNPSFTDDAIPALRKSGLLTLTQVESGEVYMPPGMGVVSSADSAKAVHSTQFVLNRLREIETEIKRAPDQFKEKIFRSSGRSTEHLDIELKIVKGIFFIKENNSDYMEYIFQNGDYDGIN